MTRFSKILFIALISFTLYRQIPIWKSSYSQEGQKINSSEAIDLKGKLVSLPITNKKMVYIFWTTWCVPCRAQFKIIENTLSKKLLTSSNVLAVNLGEDLKAVLKYKQSNNMQIPIVILSAKDSWETFNVQATPTISFVDEGGIIKYFTSGISPAISIRINNFLSDSKSTK